MFSLVVICSLLLGCLSKNNDVGLLSESKLFQQAQHFLDVNNYEKAIDKLRSQESLYPFGSLAEQGQLDLLYAYFQNKEPEAARAAAERFIRLHPQHPHVDYAYYIKGMASNVADMGIIERYISVDMAKRDPGQARQSFKDFDDLLKRFPDSVYASDARQRMIALRNRLAMYEIHVADYYMKRKAYVAAINRGRYVVEQMQGTPATELGLGIMIEGYIHLKLDDPANKVLSVLKENYPKTQLVGDNGEFVGFRVYHDVDPSIWSIITFGLIDSVDSDDLDDYNTTNKPRSFLNKITFGLLGEKGNVKTVRRIDGKAESETNISK